jgi:hypothetical protein
MKPSGIIDPDNGQNETSAPLKDLPVHDNIPKKSRKKPCASSSDLSQDLDHEGPPASKKPRVQHTTGLSDLIGAGLICSGQSVVFRRSDRASQREINFYGTVIYDGSILDSREHCHSSLNSFARSAFEEAQVEYKSCDPWRCVYIGTQSLAKVRESFEQITGGSAKANDAAVGTGEGGGGGYGAHCDPSSHHSVGAGGSPGRAAPRREAPAARSPGSAHSDGGGGGGGAGGAGGGRAGGVGREYAPKPGSAAHALLVGLWRALREGALGGSPERYVV